MWYHNDMRKHSDEPHPDPTTLDWIFARCHPVPFSGCWLWTKTLNHKGYALISVKRAGRFHTVIGHRESYRLHYGMIDDGLQVDHLCRVRCCVNPEHLELVAPIVNAQRGWADNPDRSAVLAAGWKKRRAHTLLCQACSGSFIAMHPGAKHCSHACTNRAYRARIKLRME